MGNIHLVTGGVKSGKSSYAVRLASELAGDTAVRFIATARRGIGDDSLDRRIDRHIEERPTHWTSFDSPTGFINSVEQSGNETIAVLDCVTLWIGDLMTAPNYDQSVGTSADVNQLIESLQSSERPTIVITNEVGSGVAPSTVIGNDYADELGTANRLIATTADEVTLLVAGQPLRIK